MSSKSHLTVQSLIELLEKQRRTFTDRYRPLLTSQETALQKANSLVAEPPESLKRNYSRKMANNVLNDIKKCISPDVFVLCALAANPSALGTAKLGDYVLTIGRWWEGVHHPKGLTVVSKSYGMVASKTPALVQGIYQDILEDRQHANQSDSEHESLNDDSPNNHLTIRPERTRKRKHASTDDVSSEQVSGAIHSLGPILTSCTSTPPKRTHSERTVVPETSSNHPNIAGKQEQRVIENASIQGIANVFEEHMCGAIRRVTVRGDMKAALTTVLPVWGGPVDCLMSLDICERDVERLAMALFNAKVKWMGQVLHVVFKDGMTMMIPHSEATLKGVLDDAIIKVFGPEIHAAITECPIRGRELEDEKRVTECVSMIFTTNGAIINLSLGLKGGLQIQNKLYT